MCVMVEKTCIDLGCKRCKYKWTYHGSSDWYTSCPMCRGPVSVRNAKIALGMMVK